MVEELRRLWVDRCDIAVRVPEKNPETGRTLFAERFVVSDEPCRVSFKLAFENVSGAKDKGMYMAVSQAAKLFMDRDISVPPGSKITVRRGDEVLEFCRSGPPALYDYHQEVKVEKFKDWA